MTTLGSLVSIVDNDVSVRDSLPEWLREFGLAARAFASAKEFLDSDAFLATERMVLDNAMPGMSGLKLWDE